MLRIDAFNWLRVTMLAVVMLLANTQLQAETESPERITWRKAPIQLELAVGQESRVFLWTSRGRRGAAQLKRPGRFNPRVTTESFLRRTSNRRSMPTFNAARSASSRWRKRSSARSAPSRRSG